MKLTYVIGPPEDAFRQRVRQPYGDYYTAVLNRPHLDYDVLYVSRGQDLVLALDLEGLYQKYAVKPYRKKFRFHDKMERMLKFLLREHL